MNPTPIIIEYTNHRNETSKRKITPSKLYFGTHPFHPERQWFLIAYCFERMAERTFAMSRILGWRECDE